MDAVRITVEVNCSPLPTSVVATVTAMHGPSVRADNGSFVCDVCQKRHRRDVPWPCPVRRAIWGILDQAKNA